MTTDEKKKTISTPVRHFILLEIGKKGNIYRRNEINHRSTFFYKYPMFYD